MKIEPFWILSRLKVDWIKFLRFQFVAIERTYIQYGFYFKKKEKERGTNYTLVSIRNHFVKVCDERKFWNFFFFKILHRSCILVYRYMKIFYDFKKEKRRKSWISGVVWYLKPSSFLCKTIFLNKFFFIRKLTVKKSFKSNVSDF